MFGFVQGSPDDLDREPFASFSVRGRDRNLVAFMLSGLACPVAQLRMTAAWLNETFGLAIKASSLAGHTGNGEIFMLARADDIVSAAERDLQTLSHELGNGQLILVGSSMGALALADIASRRPELIRCAILADMPLCFCQRLHWIQRGVNWLSTNCRWLRPRLEQLSLRRRPKVDLVSPNHSGFDRFPLLTGASILALQQRLVDRLPDIRCPVLLLDGEHDPYPERGWGEFVARQIPEATRVIIPDAGHRVFTYSEASMQRSRAAIAEWLPSVLNGH